LILERALPAESSLSVNFVSSRGDHVLRTRDINAPLPGTYTGAKKYSLTATVNARNIFNIVNLSPPQGVLTSPFFGESTSLAGPRWKIFVGTCVPLPGNAGRTGTSQSPNSKRRGSKAVRNFSTLTAKRMPKLSVNRIRGLLKKINWQAKRPAPLACKLLILSCRVGVFARAFVATFVCCSCRFTYGRNP
jgi:hypothetical protein